MRDRGGTPTEQAPSNRSRPYLDTPLVPGYYPDEYWRVVDGAMDESNPTLHGPLGSMFDLPLEGSASTSTSTSSTSRHLAEVFSRFTTEAAKLFADWILTPDGQAHTANAWFLAPIRDDVPADELTPDPVWGVTNALSDLRTETEFTSEDSVLMPFDDRTTRSSQKAKYKDMWYNIMTA